MLRISLKNKQIKVLQSMQNKSQLNHLEKIYASASSNTLNEKHKYLSDDTSFLPSSGTANRLTSKENSKSCFSLLCYGMVSSTLTVEIYKKNNNK